ncbi:hypothetical protein PsYK624_111030 [Phanerochaete sordida]|uniref:Uncharacterized protein n=1 Tax=Phanerochaete sordida TaxID=48140 RepID=A0A9P3GFY9_9APHY|nr:hypothetical protein PsYK624_111030 [Phanerochaete sordida]
MPKETPQKTSKQRSPAKRKEPKQPPPPPKTDESTWRQSRVPLGKTICATDISTLYRLHADDLRGLTYVEKPSGKIRDMKEYQERDVERVAWKKHGSPERFEAHLDKLEKQWNARPGQTKAFPDPRLRWSATGTVTIISSTSLLEPENPEERWTANAHLRHIKTLLPPWLWRACNTALDKTEDPPDGFDDVLMPRVANWEREAALKGARRLAGTYPVRPAVPHVPTPAVERLREVLEQAPKDKKDKDMEVWENDSAEGSSRNWSERYEAQLFAALIEVIEAHGVAGWESVRWEVYDKYRDCLVDLKWNRQESRWYDDAADWLYGRLVHRPDTASSRHCHCSDIGRQYNAMLPICRI